MPLTSPTARNLPFGLIDTLVTGLYSFPRRPGPRAVSLREVARRRSIVGDIVRICSDVRYRFCSRIGRRWRCGLVVERRNRVDAARGGSGFEEALVYIVFIIQFCQDGRRTGA